MASIIRCTLPDGVHKFKPFTVADYRDFLLVRNDMNTKTPTEQKEILDSLLDDYFSEYPVAWRPYVFIHVFTGSIGKTRIPVSFECKSCGKTKRTMFNMKLDPLVSPSIEVAGVKINFKFPEKEFDELSDMVINSIDTIEHEGETHTWESLSDDNQLSIIDAIDYSLFEQIVSKLTPLDMKLNVSCCKEQIITYTDFVSVFKILLHPDEIFTFYQINHILVKSQYDLQSIMGMIPIERGIALSLVEKDNKVSK